MVPISLNDLRTSLNMLFISAKSVDPEDNTAQSRVGAIYGGHSYMAAPLALIQLGGYKATLHL